MKRILLFVVMAVALLYSCHSKGEVPCQNKSEIVDTVERDNPIFENPIDSIIGSTNVETRMEEVYKFLANYPDFINNSDSVGYYCLRDGTYDKIMIWKDCGLFRIYSIPCETLYASLCYNFIQYKDSGILDTFLLDDEKGGMDEFFEVKSKNGEMYYVFKTSYIVCHQGLIRWEFISAFTIKNGHLVNEKLFHTNRASYDRIEVEAGGQRYAPLVYNELSLIGLSGFEEKKDIPTIVIEVVNDNDWPTGDGLKYEWDGSCFKYVGKCKYDADGYY